MTSLPSPTSRHALSKLDRIHATKTATGCVIGTGTQQLLRLFSAEDAPKLPKEVARAWLACVFARSPQKFHEAVARLFGHSSDDVLRLVRFLEDLEAGGVSTLGNYKNLKPAWPTRGKFYDGRAWLLLAIASHGASKELRQRLISDFSAFQKHATTAQELAVAADIGDRLGVSVRDSS